jgi:hypothetical protein
MPSAVRHLPVLRPVTRADCVDGPRPCGVFSCKYNLSSHVDERGTLHLSIRGRRFVISRHATTEEFEAISDAAVDELVNGPPTPNCALDVAEQHPTVEQVAAALQVSRQRLSVIESVALTNLRSKLAAAGIVETPAGMNGF